MSNANEQPVAATAQSPTPAPEETAAGASVRRGGISLGLVILLSLGWYLLADRFTPYTNQARVEGYVIGVAPKVAGLVTRVMVANNQEVVAGQPLFEIDTSQYEIALEKARSDLENAVRQVAAGDAAVEAARANLLAAEANRVKAEKDFSRLQRLYREDPGTISQRRLEISRASLDQAHAGVTAARADIDRAIEQKGGDDSAGNTLLKTARSAVAQAELDLANTVVTASSDGVITDLRADVGQYAGTGSPVLTLIALHDVWIRAEFTENNLGHLRPGTALEIAFDALPGRVVPGRVRSIGLGVSTGQTPPPGTLPTIDNNRDWLRQSQRFPVIVDFELPPDSDDRRQLRVGAQASVMAYTDGHPVLKLLGKAYIRLMSWLSYAY